MRWGIAAAAAIGLSGCGDPALSEPTSTLSPVEVVLDFGVLMAGETASMTFEVHTTVRSPGVTLGLPAGYELPEGFSFEPQSATAQAGLPARFTITFAPCGVSPGPMNFEVELRAPGASPERVRVVVRAILAFTSRQSDPNGCLDFGALLVGESRSLPLPVTGWCGPDVARFDLGIAETAFTVKPRSIEIRPGESHEVTVTFTPPSRGPYAADLVFSWHDWSGVQPASVRRCLLGVGALEVFELDPPALDFAEGAGCGEVTIENTGDLSMHVRSIELSEGLLTVPGAFAVQDEGLVGREIDPTGTATFHLCFTPSGGAGAFSGEVQVATDHHLVKLSVTAPSP